MPLRDVGVVGGVGGIGEVFFAEDLAGAHDGPIAVVVVMRAVVVEGAGDQLEAKLMDAGDEWFVEEEFPIGAPGPADRLSVDGDVNRIGLSVGKRQGFGGFGERELGFGDQRLMQEGETAGDEFCIQIEGFGIAENKGGVGANGVIGPIGIGCAAGDGERAFEPKVRFGREVVLSLETERVIAGGQGLDSGDGAFVSWSEIERLIVE